MIVKGTVHVFGDNINTDDIIAAQYLDSQDERFLGSKCMENIDPGFSAKVARGDILVGGANFGCGSSREHAPVALKGCGISLVIAKSFARIFYRNCINVGLPILVCQDAGAIPAGSTLVVDLERGIITDTVNTRVFHCEKFPAFMQEIIDRGGLIKWIKAKKEVSHENTA